MRSWSISMNAMPARFGLLFAEDFDAPEAPGAPDIPEPEVIAPEATVPDEMLFTEAELEAAREAGRIEGEAAGMWQARAALAAEERETLSRIAATLEDARADAARVAEDAAEGTARLMLGMLLAALPATCARHGEAELRAMASRILPALAQEPRVTIRVHPHHLDALRQELARLDPEQSARAVLLPTDAMPPGDLRIAWESGHAVRDARALAAAMEEALAPLGLLAGPDAAVEARELAHAG
jgi:flagellar assembly protein FliH